jgi:hypothetical protein
MGSADPLKNFDGNYDPLGNHTDDIDSSLDDKCGGSVVNSLGNLNRIEAGEVAHGTDTSKTSDRGNPSLNVTLETVLTILGRREHVRRVLRGVPRIT